VRSRGEELRCERSVDIAPLLRVGGAADDEDIPRGEHDRVGVDAWVMHILQP